MNKIIKLSICAAALCLSHATFAAFTIQNDADFPISGAIASDNNVSGKCGILIVDACQESGKCQTMTYQPSIPECASGSHLVEFSSYQVFITSQYIDVSPACNTLVIFKAREEPKFIQTGICHNYQKN